jgi:hypothetical protein
MPSLEDAIALAALAHHGQVDKAGVPYILHPLRVMLRMATDASSSPAPPRTRSPAGSRSPTSRTTWT